MTPAEKRQEIIKSYKTHDKDSGSPQVQIALLTDRINSINEHLKKARKDHHSRRGLLVLVGRRNRLLKYMQKIDREGYKTLIGSLGLRK
ncbi:MAG: 30S ribosomal protein S15 [Planctomycetes bacterium]|nr:30S ribosomal protein S15 [Planctomycetota bacterium]